MCTTSGSRFEYPPPDVMTEMRYLVTSTDGSPKTHTRYSSALADVRRRLGVTYLHRDDRQTRREMEPDERSRQLDGDWWSCFQADEYTLSATAAAASRRFRRKPPSDPTQARRATLYYLERRAFLTTSTVAQR
jgi:hypothetical protein